MDQVDRRLIAALTGNARASYAELARTVGLSSSAVHERVGKLEASGVILGYRAVLDPRAVGTDVTALVGIQPGEHADDETIAEALERLPEVETCYAVAGEEAFLVVVRVPNVAMLHACLLRLRAIDGVARTHTTIVLATRFESRPRAWVPDSEPIVEDS